MLRSLIAACLWAGLLSTAIAVADTDSAWAPDIKVGADMPELAAADQHGMEQTFDSLVGEQGLLMLFSRSVGW